MSDASWVQVHADRASLGHAAAQAVADELRQVINARGSARMIFAAAPSQAEMLDELVTLPDIDWSRVTAFHMDEYIGLPPDHPAGFVNWLDRHMFTRVPFGTVHRMQPGDDPVAAAAAYAALLTERPIDIVCLGIGVNGHIAFNDPPVADFNDLKMAKVVELDQTCRQQQVDDGGFASLPDVPSTAITLTIPALLSGLRLFCVVPGSSKAKAVQATLTAEITTQWPSTILRNHPACTLFLDRKSAALLDDELVG